MAEPVNIIGIDDQRILVFFLPASNSIRPHHLLEVIDQLDNLPKTQDKLVMLLNSHGGDVYSAYKMVKAIRSRVGHLTVVIPSFAKSAATLMSLAADNVVMAAYSELGPLDLPVEHPTAGLPLSSLDAVNAVEYFASVTDSQAMVLARSVRNSSTGIAQKDALELSLSAIVRYLTPIVCQLDPQLVHKSFRELQIAERYASEFLREHMLAESVLKNEKAEQISRSLVWDYPAHGFAISRDEARRLGLAVTDAEEYDEWNLFWQFYRLFGSERPLIALLEMAFIQKMVNSGESDVDEDDEDEQPKQGHKHEVGEKDNGDSETNVEEAS